MRVKAIKVRAAAAKVTTMAQHGELEEVGANSKEQAAVLQSRWRRAAKRQRQRRETDQEACKSRSQSLQNIQRRDAEEAPSGQELQNMLKQSTMGEDMTAIEDKETDVEGEQAHTMQEVHKRTAKNTKAEFSER